MQRRIEELMETYRSCQTTYRTLREACTTLRHGSYLPAGQHTGYQPLH